MPATSQAQAGFMGMVVSGRIKKKGLSKNKAREFLRGTKKSALPKRGNRKKA